MSRWVLTDWFHQIASNPTMLRMVSLRNMKKGFDYAIKSGADFICVGMYDFQIVKDVNIALEVLPKYKQHERPGWA